MAEDFWAPVFARLLVDYEFLELVVNDTTDADLVSWIRPNRALFARCARFLKKNRVLDKPALAREMLIYAREDEALRKIILYTWVEKNPLTMRFPTLVVDAAAEEQLQSGEFGSLGKINILARIDPRAAIKPLYERVLATCSIGLESDSVTPVPSVSQSFDEKARQKFELRIGELERVLDGFKTENRQLKKQLEARQSEITAQNRRIEEYSHKLKQAEQSGQVLASEAAGLRSRVSFLEKLSAQPQPLAERVDSTDNSDQITALSEELGALRRAVENREATIRRLEGEKSELAARQATDSEKDRQIAALRQRLADLEPLKQGSGQRLAGQLISSHKDSSGKRSWLFLSISGRVIFVEGTLVNKTSVVREEFCLLHLDSDERPVALESLETDARREICGCIDDSGDDLSLVADAQRFKVRVEIAESQVGIPVRCVWLPAFVDRSAGIYRVEVLSQQQQADIVQKTADIRQVMAFFKADRLNFDRFVELLREQNIAFTVVPNHIISFATDYHEVLEPLRMRGRVYKCCGSANCQMRAGAEIMVRQLQPGQACDFCASVAPEVSDKKQFFGQRVLIFGGDYVGSEYERTLAGYNLKVEWHSGFKNLAELKNGFGHPDLVVIIVRQISHTLLRELAAMIERDSLPALYSSRRGISGVLDELSSHFGLAHD
ncbi:MAG: DUF2325 domain-containing protein [Candidatus Riflebacteria bacterium]|nr:DUF2325 domain-containing protein [Candidatus Riflebacteria bacterium]